MAGSLLRVVRMSRRYLPFVAWFLTAAVAGCAVVPPPAATPEEEVARTPVSRNGAVVALIDAARVDANAGRLPAAGAALERALRIEPRNPRLWHELARVKLRQGEHAQAAGMAARSNTWAGSDKVLRAANWRLIGEARLGKGDERGARAAFDKADALVR